MDYLVISIIVILLLIIIYAVVTTPPPLTVGTVPMISTVHNITIVDPRRRQDIEKYCQSWNYTYTDTIPENTSDIVLVMHDEVSQINMDVSLSLIASVGTNVKYIAFDNSNNYILFDKIPKITETKITEEINNITLPKMVFKNILSEGYPYVTDNGLILHRAYLDNIFHNISLPFNVPVIMPNNIPSRVTMNSNKIPKIIHQTFKTRFLPSSMVSACYSWINRNPDYEYRYYDDIDQRNFILEHFDNDVLAAYDSLIPGAYKADLWRYCMIFVKGGIYIDIKMGSVVPLSQIIDDDTELLVINDTHDMTLYNAFFAAIPRHPAILATIKLVTQRVLNREYGSHILYPTGPLAMGEAILSRYNLGPHAPNGKYQTNEGIIQVYSHISKNNKTHIIDTNSHTLVKTRHPGITPDTYIHKITGHPHYRFLWNQRSIYK